MRTAAKVTSCENEGRAHSAFATSAILRVAPVLDGGNDQLAHATLDFVVISLRAMTQGEHLWSPNPLLTKQKPR